MSLIPPLHGVDGDGEAISAANSTTIESGRLVGHNNDGNDGKGGLINLAHPCRYTPVLLGRLQL